MITSDVSSSFPTHTSKKKQLYQLKFEQDAIFSGFEYFNSVLDPSIENLQDIVWHVKDGESILKGQTCLEIFENKECLDKIVEVISYLSGVSTLARCYAESSHQISIVGNPLKDSPLFEWEKKSLSCGGIDTKPFLPQKICYSKEDLNLQDPVVALSSEIPKDDLKKILKKIPSQKTKGLYGPILPQEIEKFNGIPIDIIWPDFLQGAFPSVKIEIHGNQ